MARSFKLSAYGTNSARAALWKPGINHTPSRSRGKLPVAQDAFGAGPSIPETGWLEDLFYREPPVPILNGLHLFNRRHSPVGIAAVFDLITKVSKALEEKYSARKTYVLMIGDSNKWQHLHFHLIPKHRYLPSMGVYTFQKLAEDEPTRDTPDDVRAGLATEIRELIQGE